MFKKIFLITIALLPCVFAMAQAEIEGVVTDKTSQKFIEGVHVVLSPGNHSTITDAKGAFQFSGIASGTYTLKLQHLSYGDLVQTVRVSNVAAQKRHAIGFNLAMLPNAYMQEEVIISATRADHKTPLTTSTLTREQLQENKVSPAMPYAIETEPSVVVSAENGMVGATSFRIRGVDATRINVNINGITLNDPESQAVFWYNIPNLGGMAQSIQLQRGIGASAGGSASLGGALNLQTLGVTTRPYAEAELAHGSFNTRQYGITAGTGLTKKGFAFDMAYNGLNSDGFVRNGMADQQSLFVSGGYYGKRSLLKAVFILGSQHTGITWDGASAEDLDKDPHFNGTGSYYDEFGNVHYYDNETDNYNQRHYQLYYSFLLDDHWTLNAAFDFTHGDGYYEQYKDNKKPGSYYGLTSMTGTKKSDFVHRKEMFNSAYTGVLSAGYRNENFSLQFGNSFLYYDGNHFGNLIWAQDSLSVNGTDYLNIAENTPYEWYRNKGKKTDNTSYIKMNFDITKLFNMYADLQLRHIDYQLNGMDASFDSMTFHEKYLFFNPKLGMNYNIDDSRRLYFVAGMVGREPTRSDIKDAIINHDTIKAETMLDFELGYGLQKTDLTINANLYAMLYKNQLTPSGDLSSSGYALMENVDKSYRIGVELAAGYRFCRWFSLDGNLTLSSNKIIGYTYTDFNDGDTTLQTYTANTDLSFSPSVVGAGIATFRPFKNAKIQLVGKYVGKQFCDNTSREIYALDPYFLLNLRTAYTWQLNNGNEVELQFVVNNLTNHSYRLSAWVGDYEWDDYYYHSRAYLQQPGINYMLRMIARF